MSLGTRVEAAVVVLMKASMVAALAYVVSLEFEQLKANAERARAEACIARQKNAINFSSMNELMAGHAGSILYKDCKHL
jgi:hypothetical protein